MLTALCVRGIQVRARGWCLGELRPAELTWSEEQGVQRAPRVTLRARGRASRHARTGHDRGCWAVGIPHMTIRRVVRAWAEPEAEQYLNDAVDEVIEDVLGDLQAGAPWSAARASEALEYVMQGRITRHRPSVYWVRAESIGARLREEAEHQYRELAEWLHARMRALRFRGSPQTLQPRGGSSSAPRNVPRRRHQ